MITIDNEYISAGFSADGAELRSLSSTQENIEYLWNGNPDFWSRYSPVLFPIVGQLKENAYRFDGQEYALPRHGFARDKEFKAEQLSQTEVLFTLTHDQETLKRYPFEFILTLQYEVSGPRLTCTYTVSNPGTKPLLFSIGSHPAFATPVINDLNYQDYYLQFNKDSQLVYHKINNDLIDDETVIVDLENNALPLKHNLFYEDALVFKTLKSDCISLRNTKNPHGINFYFQDFPYFGIWAAKDADFVCLEAWCGIADGINHDKELKNKEGIITLSPGNKWQRSWSVECF